MDNEELVRRVKQHKMGWPQATRLMVWYVLLAFVAWLIFVGVTQ